MTPRKIILSVLLLLLILNNTTAARDDEDTAGPSGHAPSQAIGPSKEERYLQGLESRIQSAAKHLGALQKAYNHKKDDSVASANLRVDLEAARTHLHELEARLDAYMLEVTRAQHSQQEGVPDKQPAQHASSKRKAPTDSHDEDRAEDIGNGQRNLPRSLPTPHDGYTEAKSGEDPRVESAGGEVPP